MKQKASSTALCGPDGANARALVKALRAQGFTALLKKRVLSYGDFYTVKTNCMGEQFSKIWDTCPMMDDPQ